jgi:hypothetical protein
MMRISNQYGKSATWADTDSRKDYGSKKWEKESIHIQFSGEHSKIYSTVTSALASPARESITYNDHHRTKGHRPNKLIREHARNNINFKKIDPLLEAGIEDSPKGWDLIGVKGWHDRKAITPPSLVATSWRRKGVLDGARKVG